MTKQDDIKIVFLSYRKIEIITTDISEYRRQDRLSFSDKIFFFFFVKIFVIYLLTYMRFKNMSIDV